MFKLAALALATLACCGANAQTTLHYKEGQRVDPRDVVRILDASPSAMKTRSIRLLDQPSEPDSALPSTARATVATASALSLPVRFAFNSAQIVPSARPQLDALAEGIKLLPPGQPVVIEGHTDASGPDEYNRALSVRRAFVVKQYLVRVHGIEAARLRDTGFGKERPIGGIDPHAAENRRVQFRGA